MTTRHYPFLLISLLLLVVAAVSCSKKGSTGGGWLSDITKDEVDTIPMMVQQVKQCSRLYTAEYKVHKIVTHSDTTKITGSVFGQKMSLSLPGGRRKVAIPIDATLKAYIDFSEFGEDDVRRENGRLYITLPRPHVVMTSSTIDHAGIKKYVSIIRSNFTDEELSLYEKQGRQDIINEVPKLGILQTARRSAATQLMPIVAMLGIPQEEIVINFNNPDEEEGGLTWIMD